MLRNKSFICLLVLSAFVSLLDGCVTLNGGDKEKLLRSSIGDIESENYVRADKKARKVLKSWENNHQAMMVRVKAKLGQGNNREAIEIISQLNNLCKKDLCPNLIAHIEALILLSRLKNDEGLVAEVQEKIETLERGLRVQQYDNLVDLYILQHRPKKAEEAFYKLENATGGRLSSNQLLKGCIIYYSNFNERAKGLYRELTPRQKAGLKEHYGRLSF